MTGQTQAILSALQTGPKTSAELQDALTTDSGEIANIMGRLRKQGRVVNLSVHRAGKRNIATYALTESK